MKNSSNKFRGKNNKERKKNSDFCYYSKNTNSYEKNKIEITSQNHGFAIDPNSLSKDIVKITHYNLNDNTVAGLEVHNTPIFSVQYHPEAGPGPHDSDYLFKKFVSLMLERC